MNNCSLNDYTFGQNLNLTHIVNKSTEGVSASRDCSKKCHKVGNCSLFSWRENYCETLSGLRNGIDEKLNPVYFCRKETSMIRKKSCAPCDGYTPCIR